VVKCWKSILSLKDLDLGLRLLQKRFQCGPSSAIWTGAGYTVNGGKRLISNLRKKMEEGWKSRKGNLN
jgi:hypothetical protein